MTRGVLQQNLSLFVTDVHTSGPGARSTKWGSLEGGIAEGVAAPPCQQGAGFSCPCQFPSLPCFPEVITVVILECSLLKSYMYFYIYMYNVFLNTHRIPVVFPFICGFCMYHSLHHTKCFSALAFFSPNNASYPCSL